MEVCETGVIGIEVLRANSTVRSQPVRRREGCKGGLSNLAIREKDSTRSLFENAAMERRVKAHTLSGRRFVSVSPCIEQCVGLRQEQACVGHLRPFSVEQTDTYIADVAEADIGRLRKLSDAPSPTGITKHHPQHLRRFRLEQGLEFAPLDDRFAGNEAFDEDSIEL